MNGKKINNILKHFVPVSSTIIGAPRKEAQMKDYVQTCPNTSYIEYELIESLLPAPGFFQSNQTKVSTNNRLFTAKLPMARVWGRNGAVITTDDYFIRDVSREFNQGMGIDHSVFYTIMQKKSRLIQGEVAVIGTAGASIYYHWMLDVLPRLGLLFRTVSPDRIDYFITEYTGLSFQTETLCKLGIALDKIVASNENWRFHVRAETLWVPSLAAPLDQPTFQQVNFLRNLFKDCTSVGKAFRRLYVSRKKTGRRTIVNETELLHCLSAYQFETIYCEEMTVAEQAALFSEASVIVCSHGSALANLVFCMPGTIILDIFNPSHINPCFWYISQILHLNYNYMAGFSCPIDDNPKNDNTELNINDLKNKLTGLGLEL